MQAKSLSPTTTLRPSAEIQPHSHFLVDVPEENPSPEDVKKVMNAVKGPTQDAVDRATGSRQPIRGAGKDLNVQVSNFDPMETSGSEGDRAELLLHRDASEPQNLRQPSVLSQLSPVCGCGCQEDTYLVVAQPNALVSKDCVDKQCFGSQLLGC